MKKIINAALAACLGAAALVAALPASAQSYYLENSGRIWNRVETNAVATDNGSANSVAKGSQSSYAAGVVQQNPIAGGAALVLAGEVKTEGSGMAFNVSNGGGTGYASSQGWADANVNGFNNFSNQHGSLTMNGFTDSGMAAPVGHGVDIDVRAGRSQDGYAAGGDSGKFTVTGYTQQNPVAGGAAVVAQVSDTKESNAWSEAGAVTFSDGVPAGQTAAYRHANAGNVTEVNAAFHDPAF